VTTATTPIADAVTEAQRLAATGAEQDIPLRMMSGVAVAIRYESARRPPLQRE
jgi:hypothetical protein